MGHAIGSGQLQDLPHRVNQHRFGFAFGNITRRAFAQCLGGDILAALGGRQDDWQGRELAAELLHQFQSIHVRHVQVGHHNQRTLATNLFQTGYTIDRQRHSISRVFQNETHVRGLSRTILDEQHQFGIIHLHPLLNGFGIMTTIRENSVREKANLNEF